MAGFVGSRACGAAALQVRGCVSCGCSTHMFDVELQQVDGAPGSSQRRRSTDKPSLADGYCPARAVLSTMAAILARKPNFAKGLWSPPGSRLCHAPRFHFSVIMVVADRRWEWLKTSMRARPAGMCDDAFSTGFSRTPISMVAMTATRLWIWFSAAEGAGAADARTHGRGSVDGARKPFPRRERLDGRYAGYRVGMGQGGEWARRLRVLRGAAHHP
jgi:hypothetical protein